MFEGGQAKAHDAVACGVIEVERPVVALVEVNDKPVETGTPTSIDPVIVHGVVRSPSPDAGKAIRQPPPPPR
jgi:hypothetical protein